MLQQSASSRPATLKRKRRSSENCPANTENQPLFKGICQDEKKQKEECLREDTESCSNDRLPLTENHNFEHAAIKERVTVSPQENALVEFILDQERLVISENGGSSPSELTYVPLDVSAHSDDDFDLSEPESNSSPVANCSVRYTHHLTPARSERKHATTSFASPNCHEGADCPLPHLYWSQPEPLWKYMCIKAEKLAHTRDEFLLDNHLELTPRMRAILLEWLNEVCAAHNMLRETYYLAMDFIDRYLSCRYCIPRKSLQLIGITCLFIAAKTEEIYPIKLQSFANVTDGACTEKEILNLEVSVMEALDWRLHPVTVVNWLSVYLQLLYKTQARHSLGFSYTLFNPAVFSKACQLLDLASLDVGCVRFSYSELAFAALCHVVTPLHASKVSVVTLDEVSECYNWLLPFWLLVKETPDGKKLTDDCTWEVGPELPPGATLYTVEDQAHCYQSHSVNIEMLELALVHSQAFPTPPKSASKVC